MTPASERDDNTTGLPGLCTWRAVYVCVSVVFVVWVGLLTWLSYSFA